MLETDINIIELPSLQYCAMSAFGGDALQRKALSHKSICMFGDIEEGVVPKKKVKERMGKPEL